MCVSKAVADALSGEELLGLLRFDNSISTRQSPKNLYCLASPQSGCTITGVGSFDEVDLELADLALEVLDLLYMARAVPQEDLEQELAKFGPFSWILLINPLALNVLEWQNVEIFTRQRLILLYARSAVCRLLSQISIQYRRFGIGIIVLYSFRHSVSSI